MMLRILTALAASCMALSITAVQAQEAKAAQVIQVPGAADFLAIDGTSVWAKNTGRIERWSTHGKLAEVTIAGACGAMALYGGGLWVADCKAGTLSRIDTGTAQITATIPTGIANPQGELNVVAGAGSIWVASDAKGTIARVDPQTNAIIATIAVDPDTFTLAFGYDALWAVSSPQRTIQRIDPATNAVSTRTALGRAPGFLAAGEGAIWVQEQGDGTVARIDTHSGAISGRIKVGDNLKYGDIDTGGGKIWLRTTDDQTFVVIDPVTMTIRARVGAAAGSGALRYSPAGVWTSAHDIHTITWWPRPATIGR